MPAVNSLRHQVVALLMVCSAMAGPLGAQEASVDHQSDVVSLDAIVEAFYQVVSGPEGEPADRARDEFLHHPAALIGIPVRDDQGRAVLRMITLGQYHDAAGGPRTRPFYEYEVHREVQRFGRVAHVWSTYASSRSPGGEPFARGINSIELYWDGSRWWITSWSFDQERDGLVIPDQYLGR